MEERPTLYWGGTTANDVNEAADAMGITHMKTWASLILSIPPAYTKYIAEQWLKQVAWL